MAFIGMQYPVAVKIASETEGSSITYDTTGGGMVVGKAISGSISWDRPDNPLYADDTIAEDDNGITGGTLEFGADDLSDDARVMLLGLIKVTAASTSDPDTYDTTDDASPYVGFGYIRVRRKNGATTYQALWYHKVQFSEQTEETNTKGESIDWGTPTLSGKVFGVVIDSSGKHKFREHASFSKISDAKSWLNTKASISA